MDYDLWVRLALRSQVKYIPQTWANFRLPLMEKPSVRMTAAGPRCSCSLPRWWEIFIDDRGEVLHPKDDRTALEFAPAAQDACLIEMQNEYQTSNVEY